MIWGVTEVIPIPAFLIDLVVRNEPPVEAIAETMILVAKYLEGEEPSSEELRAGLRRATLANHLVPVLCGAALRNKGVQPF